MNELRINDFDVIFLSYDEPNAEKNYADLCKIVPWAKRVHGVKGSDSAHKAAAQLSETIALCEDNASNNLIHCGQPCLSIDVASSVLL